MRKQQKRGARIEAPRCPYCGSHSVLRSADGIYKDNSNGAMLYVCKNYPKCDSYVRVHPGTRIPMGTLANGELRALRMEAHRHFNQLYMSGIMSKQDAYQWLSAVLAAPMSQTHIGYLGEYYCRLVIEESKKVLNSRKIRAHSKTVNHRINNGKSLKNDGCGFQNIM